MRNENEIYLNTTSTTLLSILGGLNTIDADFHKHLSNENEQMNEIIENSTFTKRKMNYAFNSPSMNYSPPTRPLSQESQVNSSTKQKNQREAFKMIKKSKKRETIMIS